MSLDDNRNATASDDAASGNPEYPFVRLIVTLMLLISGLYYMYFSSKLSIGDMSRPGPGMYPLVVSSVVVLVAAVSVVQAIAIWRRSAATHGPDKLRMRKIALFVAVAVVSTLVLKPFGFLPSTALLSAAVLWLMMGISPIRCLLYGASISFGVYLAFTQIFSIRLPSTPFLPI